MAENEAETRSDETACPDPTSLIVSPPSKLGSWDLYRSLDAPKHIVAPMVDQSELAWRILSRLHGADLVYTPMIHAAMFSTDEHTGYLKAQFDLGMGEEGRAGLDRPLLAQFCANDPEVFLKAAMRLAQPGVCDAVDLNLGCPQGIAKRGRYGAFLFEDWALIEKLIHHLHVNLPVPITAKFRVTDDVETSVKYAQMLERAGAQILCCHGRTREQKGHNAGLADWDKIAAIKKAVSVPVFANGNILVADDVRRCLEATGCDGVMSAEGNLSNPALFAPLTSRDKLQATLDGMPAFIREALAPLVSSVDGLAASNPPIVDTARRYLAIVKALGTRTATSAIKAHLFKLLRPLWAPESGTGTEFYDVRDQLSSVGTGGGEWSERVDDYLKLIDELAVRLEDERHREPDSADWPHYTRVQACVRPAVANKRALSPSATDGDVSKRQKPADVICSKCASNKAALTCSTSSCWTCCPAGDACETHERKARKQAERSAAKSARKADRKAKRNQK